MLDILLEQILISSFRKVKTTKENIDKYKYKYPSLKHVKTGENYDGVMMFDNDKYVGLIQVDIPNNFIVALEISKDYRRKGIATKLLKYAKEKFNANRLSVNKKNTNAIKLYNYNNFITYDETEFMYFMKIRDS